MILDTNAISALLEDDEGLHARIAAEPALYLPVIAIVEFRFGLLGSRLRETLEEKLAALIRRGVVLDVTEATTRHYAELRQALKPPARQSPQTTYGSPLWLASTPFAFSLGTLILTT